VVDQRAECSAQTFLCTFVCSSQTAARRHRSESLRQSHPTDEPYVTTVKCFVVVVVVVVKIKNKEFRKSITLKQRQQREQQLFRHNVYLLYTYNDYKDKYIYIYRTTQLPIGIVGGNDSHFETGLSDSTQSSITAIGENMCQHINW
jgi:hypothetical protein